MWAKCATPTPAGIRKSKLDWDFEVTDGAFRDSAGRHELVFAITPEKVLAFGKNPFTAHLATGELANEITALKQQRGRPLAERT
jgi:hypothetical protein